MPKVAEVWRASSFSCVLPERPREAGAYSSLAPVLRAMPHPKAMMLCLL